MSRPRVHVTFPIVGPARALLEGHDYDLTIHPEMPPMARDDLLEAVAPCRGVLCSLFDRIDEDFFAAAPDVEVVAQFGVGFDNIDVEAADRRGVVCTNTPDVLTDATAEMAWALLLAAARRLGEGERLVRSGEWIGWKPGQMLGSLVTGKTLGLIGPGRIGAEMALMSRGFRMDVVYTARHPNKKLESELGARRLPLDELLAAADFVSVHVPLTAETRHMIGGEELKRMKPTAVLVNTSRGPVVDEAALVTALREKTIAAAGLDVYEREPKLTEGLAELDNVVLAPHLGSATIETRGEMGLLAARNLIAVLGGEAPITPINRAAPKKD